jgi:hypothetical protein
MPPDWSQTGIIGHWLPHDDKPASQFPIQLAVPQFENEEAPLYVRAGPSLGEMR